MANNYLQFSFDFIVPASQRGWLSEVIQAAEDCDDVDLPEHSLLASIFPKWDEYQELGFCIDLQMDDGVCWIHAEDSGNTDSVVSLLMALLSRCHNDMQDLKEVGFTYSETCSSMRVGEFGGGAIRVFLNGSTPEVGWMNASTWLSNAICEGAKP